MLNITIWGKWEVSSSYFAHEDEFAVTEGLSCGFFLFRVFADNDVGQVYAMYVRDEDLF